MARVISDAEMEALERAPARAVISDEEMARLEAEPAPAAQAAPAEPPMSGFAQKAEDVTNALVGGAVPEFILERLNPERAERIKQAAAEQPVLEAVGGVVPLLAGGAAARTVGGAALKGIGKALPLVATGVEKVGPAAVGLGTAAGGDLMHGMLYGAGFKQTAPWMAKALRSIGQVLAPTAARTYGADLAAAPALLKAPGALDTARKLIGQAAQYGPAAVITGAKLLGIYSGPTSEAEAQAAETPPASTEPAPEALGSFGGTPAGAALAETLDRTADKSDPVVQEAVRRLSAAPLTEAQARGLMTAAMRGRNEFLATSAAVLP